MIVKKSVIFCEIRIFFFYSGFNKISLKDHLYKFTCLSLLLIVTRSPPLSLQNCLLSDQVISFTEVKNPLKAITFPKRI